MSELDRPIIVGVDGTVESKHALRWALHEASCRRAPIRVITCQPSTPMEFSPGQSIVALRPEDAKQALDDAVAYARARLTGAHVHGDLVYGNAAAALIEASATAALVVIGSRPKSKVNAVVIGSVGSAVAAQAGCPVVVVRGGESRPLPNRVVVGVDDSPASARALEFAIESAALHQLSLNVVHAWRPFQAVELPVWTDDQADRERETVRRWLVEHLAPYRHRHPGVEISADAIAGRPAAVLVEQSESAQLVVVGSHGAHRTADIELGSVCQAVLHNSACSIAVIHA